MTNLNIRARIVLGLAIILFIALLSTSYSLYNNTTAKYESDQVSTSWIPAIENLGHMKGFVATHYLLVSDRIANRDASTIEVFTTTKNKIEKDLELATKIYADTLLTYQPGDPEADKEKALYADYQTKRDVYLKIASTAIASIGSSDAEAKQKEFSDKGPAAFRQAYDAMETILKFNLDGTSKAADKVKGLVMYSENVMLVALATMLIAGGFIMWVVPRSVIRPVNQAVKLAQHIADGDLSHKIVVTSNDELGQLLKNLEAMRTNLALVVSNVRQGSESVATASAEIAQGNHDLSSRTENQASALEETAASMEELASTVKQNAQDALDANQMAQKAAHIANRGGTVVSEVVTTMREINESSQKIADIISVIDGIAFQTNILALNAAVEAARAGEQGRGFAVVASEVRSLAGRSAEAAKEIKKLITASVERVGKGTTQVDQAGTTMTEVVAAINNVTSIVAAISSASTEQASGIEQVGEAVAQMDQVTQQNAALVEEMAAAASSLKAQAEDLVQAVAVFQINPEDVQTT